MTFLIFFLDIFPILLSNIQSSESKNDCNLFGIRDHCLRTIAGIARFSGGSNVIQTKLKDYGIQQEVTLTIQGQRFQVK